MQCSCCRGQVEAGQAKCLTCGFPLLIGGDNSEGMNDIIINHRKNKLLTVSVLLKVYSYICENGSIIESENEYIKLPDIVALEFDKITWSDGIYEDVNSDTPFTLTVQVNNTNGSFENSLSFVPNKEISRSAVGVMLCDGFKLRLAIGDKENYILSNEFNLL